LMDDTQNEQIVSPQGNNFGPSNPPWKFCVYKL